MSTFVRPLVDAAGARLRMALSEGHQPQVNIAAAASRGEDECERALGGRGISNRNVDLEQAFELRAIRRLVLAGSQVPELDAFALKSRSLPFGGDARR